MEKLQLRFLGLIMMKSLYERSLYLDKDIDYLFNCEIREYDMQEAGFNLIREFKLLKPKQIEYLETLDKDQRHIRIGLYQKDKDFANIMKEAFIKARKIFFEQNELNDSDILSIKKDAIFVIKKQCINNKYGFINFRIKNQYLGYLHLNKMEFYYTNPNTDLDIKNVNEESITYQKEYMIDFIKDLFTMTIYNDRKAVIKFLTDFIKAYRNNELDNEYYREFNSGNFFKIYEDNQFIDIKEISNDYNPQNIIKIYNYFNYLIPIANIYI